jgi:hypothetical protein
MQRTREVRAVRETLSALSLGVVLASIAHGGEFKVHHWPTAFIPQEVCDIPVMMDVSQLWVCRVLGTPVKLLPVGGVGNFEGCGSILVQCNSNVTLTCSIDPTGEIQGTYSASLAESDIDAPGGTTKLCVTLTDAVPGGQAGRTNVKVAIVKITVSPR